jgi:putative Mg2+ transporter-C (MgtC) family protein
MLSPLHNLFELPQLEQVVRVIVRLVTAALVGGVLGAEREAVGKAAGLRTHMLVSMGAALFVIFPTEAGMPIQDLSRVVQGVATGIGFIGAGAILKRTDREDISGLTTAAGLWLTGAIGLAAGVGQLWLSFVSAFFAWIILRVLRRIERRFGRHNG